MKEAVLILGAANVQIPLIQFVQSKGYRAIVVSIPGDYPGFDIADRCIYCDVRDGKAILQEIVNENVVAVMTDQTDLPVPTVAFLVKELGLAGNDVQTALIYTNKCMMREAINEIGLPNVRYYRAHNVEDVAQNWHIYPAIIKPEDNQGSRGVCRVNSFAELRNAFDEALSFSKTQHVIVEEFFEGKEVVVEGFVKDGEYLNLGIADRIYFNIDNQFIPSQTIFPSTNLSEVQSALLQFEKKLHAHLHPSFGMTHSEYLININGDIRLVETALRGGGVYISSHLIPLYANINNYNLLLDSALGKQISLSDVEKKLQRKASAYICFYLPEGEVITIKGIEELQQLKGVVKVDMHNVEVGAHVGAMVNKTHRLGPILVTADSREEIDKLIKQVQQTLDIRVLCPDGTEHSIIWS